MDLESPGCRDFANEVAYAGVSDGCGGTPLRNQRGYLQCIGNFGAARLVILIRRLQVTILPAEDSGRQTTDDVV